MCFRTCTFRCELFKNTSEHPSNLHGKDFGSELWRLLRLALRIDLLGDVVVEETQESVELQLALLLLVSSQLLSGVVLEYW